MIIQKLLATTKGFSLIELMVTVSIIAITTGVVTTVYPVYNSKSQITASLTTLESYVKKAQSYYTDHNTDNNGFSGISTLDQLGGAYITNTATNDIISGITVTSTAYNGTTDPIIPESVSFTATFNNFATSALNGKTVTLKIAADNGVFAVSCTSNIENDYLPSSCKTPTTTSTTTPATP